MARVIASVALAGVALLVIVAADGLVRAPTPAAAQISLPDRPPDLYLRDCAFCHGNDGEGTERGPSLVGVGAASADFYLSTGRMPIERDDEVKRRAVRYSRSDIGLLVDYVASLGGGPEIPSVDVDGAGLPEGGVIYTENCAACHGSSGAGAALTSGLVATDLYESNPIEVAEAIRVGPGAMPVFGPETLDDDQLDDVVAYVDYLREPEDRGGAPLGHIGPVTEGLVGWVLGLGALVAVIRWIGTKADE